MLAARRYATDGRLVLEVSDPLDLCGGRFALEGGPHGATCQPTQASAELAWAPRRSGAISLGGVSLHVLAEAGLIEELRPGALAIGRAHVPRGAGAVVQHLLLERRQVAGRGRALVYWRAVCSPSLPACRPLLLKY